MAYDFIDGSGGYDFHSLSVEVTKFDNQDPYRYNYTYITARKEIDWLNLSNDADKKVQFLIDWNTTIVRANKDIYIQKFKTVGKDDELKCRMSRYIQIELPGVNLSDETLRIDIQGIYSTMDSIFGPTSASKILHMYNPNFFPIWDEPMRKNLFHSRSHKPYQYFSLISIMQHELQILLKSLQTSEGISMAHAIARVKELDKPTLSILRIFDKANYNNSRKPTVHDSNFSYNGHVSACLPDNKGGKAMVIVSSRRENTGLKLSDFLGMYLTNINGFSKNKPGGYSFEEERSLWKQGIMTAAFLKRVGSMLEYPTFQESNYDLLASLKRDKDNLIKLLKDKPNLDKEISIKSKGLGGGGTLKSSLLS